MKKTLSLLIALIIAISSLAAVPAYALTLEEKAISAVKALGIMVGDQNGNMDLYSNVTRAQFAKMAVRASTSKDSPEKYASGGYSLYKDVGSEHWAVGYIRAAVDLGLMVGYTDGTFRPDNNVTLEEVCTVLLRILGYDQSSLSGSYPEAQLNKASSIGLRDGVICSQSDAASRRDCAVMIYNMFISKNPAGQIYASTRGYSVTNGELDIASLSADELSGPYVTYDGKLSVPFEPAAIYKSGVSSVPAAYDVYYYNETLKTVYLYDDRVTGTYTSANPGAASPSSVVVGGKSYVLESSDVAYDFSIDGSFSYGDTVTLLLGMDGKAAGAVKASVLIADGTDLTKIISSGLKGPYIASASEVLPFSPKTVYRDGKKSTGAGLNLYDVYYYNSEFSTVWIYTKKVSGKISLRLPDPVSPASVTVSGINYTVGSADASYDLSVLSGKADGDRVTLLLGMNDAVVGVLSDEKVSATYYGMIQSTSAGVAGQNKDSLLQELTVICTDGNTRVFSLDKEQDCERGDIVCISVTSDEVSAKKLSKRGIGGDVNSSATVMGNYAFADNINIIDADESGYAVKINPERLALCSLKASDVLYYTMDNKGRIDNLILSDVTGDIWSYAYITGVNEGSAQFGQATVYTYVINGRQTVYTYNYADYPVSYGGIKIRYSSDGSVDTLRQLKNVKINSLNDLSAFAGNTEYRLSDDVQVYLLKDEKCYTTSLSSLSTAKHELTAWYDGFSYPAGKRVRIIIATEK